MLTVVSTKGATAIGGERDRQQHAALARRDLTGTRHRALQASPARVRYSVFQQFFSCLIDEPQIELLTMARMTRHTAAEAALIEALTPNAVRRMSSGIDGAIPRFGSPTIWLSAAK
jgi:hypothetical protein